MSAEETVKVRLTVYRDVLVIETVSPEETNYPGWVPIGPGTIGCVITNTKVSLGASEEALTWLQGVGKSRDDIGDLDWFPCGDGTKAFGWIGGVYSMKGRACEGSRSYEVFPDDCVRIANDPPIEATRVVDTMLDNP